MAVKAKQSELMDLESLEQAAACLKVVAHPHRLRMVQMLLRGDYTVGELAEACDIVPHAASTHLRLMQHCGLLQSDRDGRQVYYSVAEPHLADLMKCVEGRFA